MAGTGKPIKLDHSSVKKLDGAAGYPLWKLTIENIVWAAGIHEIVFGKEARHASDADKQLKWDISNRAGMGIILQTLEEKITLLIITLTLVMGDKFQEGTPVIWRKTTAPAVIGYNSISLRVNLVSPCTFLPCAGFPNPVAAKLRRQCDDQYQKSFLDELEKMCPTTATGRDSRDKRELFTALAIVAIFAVASAGVGMSAYSIHQIDKVKLTQAEIERTLDDLEVKVAANSEDLAFLKDEVRKMGLTINRLIEDVNQFKEKTIEVQYLVSYITSQLLIGRGIIVETNKLWKEGLMDNLLFDFLNLTIPCELECSMKHANPKTCELDIIQDILFMDFAVPVVNPNLTIVEADPFYLMVKEQNQTCKIAYHGPQNAMVSPNEDCVHALDMGKESRGRIFFPHSRKCLGQKLVTNMKEWFGTRSCYPSKEGDEADFIQIKVYNNKLYIYCPGSNYLLEQKRVVKCPNKVFTLPLTATFTLNNVSYHGKSMKLVYHEKEDPLFTEKLDWHLTPVVNWDSLNRTFPVFQPLSPNHWNQGENESWIWMNILGCGFGVLSLCVAWKRISECCRKHKKKATEKPRAFHGHRPRRGGHEPNTTGAQQAGEDSEESIEIRG